MSTDNVKKRYRVVLPWFGVKKGDIVELARVSKAISNGAVELLGDEAGEELAKSERAQQQPPSGVTLETGAPPPADEEKAKKGRHR